jgi:hypothetical protein
MRANRNIAVFVFAAVFSLSSGEARAQNYPQDFGYSRRTEALLDAGFLWPTNSLFHPLATDDSLAADFGSYRWLSNYLNDYRRYQTANDQTDASLLLMPGVSGDVEWGGADSYDRLAAQPFIWSAARWRQHWYARFYARFTNEPRSLPHYSGAPRRVARAGLKTGEIDQAAVGYQNDWATVEYGRGREIWGTQTEDNPVLSGNAPPYERLLLEFRHRKFAYRMFYGFLELYDDPTDGDVQRYLVGRCLEYRNRRNLVAGVAETSILTGPHRPVDWAFLNPLALHVEVEQNDRSNAGGNLDNGVWSLYLDWMTTSDLRLSGAFVLDDATLEKQERAAGKPDALGWFGRAAWTVKRLPVGVTLFASYTRIGTYTFQHNPGYNNFVTRGELLGASIGNDADRLAAGGRVVFRFPVEVEVEVGRWRWGDNSLIGTPYRPFDEYVTQPFPSGTVRRNDYLAVHIDSQPQARVAVYGEGRWDLGTRGPGSSKQFWKIGVRGMVGEVRK